MRLVVGSGRGFLCDFNDRDRVTSALRWTSQRHRARYSRPDRGGGLPMIPRRQLKYAIVAFAVLAAAAAPSVVLGADPDWKTVEQALGKTGQMQPGDVFRIGMPRTDLNVTVKGIAVKPGFALGSYAAFKQLGDHAMVMGDLVLLDQEIPAVMSGLFSGGLEVTAVHNHVNDVAPHVMYMHYEGHGEAVQLAKALRQALSASATPLGGPAAPSPATALSLDTKQIEQALGRTGREVGAGV